MYSVMVDASAVSMVEWAIIEGDAGWWKRVGWDGWKSIRDWDAVERICSRISDSADRHRTEV